METFSDKTEDFLWHITDKVTEFHRKTLKIEIFGGNFLGYNARYKKQLVCNRKKEVSRAVVAHAFNPSAWHAEAGGFLRSRRACSTKWVPGQPGLNRETVSWKKQNKKRKKKKKKKEKKRKEKENEVDIFSFKIEDFPLTYIW